MVCHSVGSQIRCWEQAFSKLIYDDLAGHCSLLVVRRKTNVHSDIVI